MKTRHQQRLIPLIRDVLLQEWDPYGVGTNPTCADEYNSWIPGIMKLLETGCDSFKLGQHLQALDILTPPGEAKWERNRTIATKLLQVYQQVLESGNLAEGLSSWAQLN